MKLIITEKSDVAKQFAKVIAGQHFTNQKGYLESQDYVITWCAGHLYVLADLEKYYPELEKEEKPKWRLDTLPCIPKDYQFKYEIKPDIKSQFGVQSAKTRIKVIRELLDRPDLEEIYNAGDPDREGEVIVQNVLRFNMKRKDIPVYRLWCDDTTASTVNAALRAKEPDTDKYSQLCQAGRARAYIDWLFGINLTRYLSIKSGTLLRTGRCKIAIVEKIAEREKQIKEFVPETYFGVTSKEKTNGEEIELTSKKTFDKDSLTDAQALCDKYNAAGAIVKSVETQRKTIKAHILFDTSSLTGYVVGKHKEIKPKQIDAALESLYQAGYTTYPRTKSAYLTEAESTKIDGILRMLEKEGYTDLVNKPTSKDIYDSRKVEGHSALIITGKKPGELSSVEQIVYDTILARFLAVFCKDPCLVDRTTMVIACSDELFKLQGDVQVELGWRKYEAESKQEKILPKLKEGDSVVVKFKPVEKKTQPPKRFTVKSFESWCKTPWRKDENDTSEYTDEEWQAILSDATVCTSATRTETISSCCDSGFISLKSGTYYAEDKAFVLIDVAQKLGVDFTLQETLDLSKLMFEVSKGQKTINDCLDVSCEKLRRMFEKRDLKLDVKAQLESAKKPICTCPICGGKIVETPKAFACANKCGVVIWKSENKYLAAFGIKKVTAKIVKSLCSAEKPLIINDVVSKKTGKKYSVIIYITKGGDGKIKYATRFPYGDESKPLGKCPVCGANVLEYKEYYGCVNHDFALFKETKRFDDIIKITSDMASMLLSGKSIIAKLTSKAGKKYSAYLKLDGVKNYAGRNYANLVLDGFVDRMKNPKNEKKKK